MGVVYTQDNVPKGTGLHSKKAQTLSETHCVLCGHLPVISPSSTTLLRELLAIASSDDWQFNDFLQAVGIHLDTHLRILMGFEPKTQTQFFWDQVPKRLNQVGLLKLMRLLKEFITERHPWAALSLTRIPRKGAAFENWLCRPGTCPKLVAHGMRLSQEEYDIFVAQIRPFIPWYLNIHRGFEEQDPQQMEKLVQKIRDDHPAVFDQYVDAWPIRVMLRRVLSAKTHGAGVPAAERATNTPPPCTFERSPASEYTQCQRPSPPLLQQQHQHRCPRLLNYHNYGGARNVSPRAITLLSRLKMDEELAPALYFLGVRDDIQFEKVRRMRRNRRIDFRFQLGEGSGLQLTALQCQVLEMIFEEGIE